MRTTLIEQIFNNRVHYACGGIGGWRWAVYLDMINPNINCPSGWQPTGYSKKTFGRANSCCLPVTQSSSLSVEDHTVRCVVGLEPNSME